MDALVIGGGPTGVSAAVTLRRSGYTPKIVEKAAFPRYHVGESLVPEGVRILEDLGLADRVAAEGFVVKPGARFVDRAAGLDTTLGFAAGGRRRTAWQVERGRFDEILLDGARDAGVAVESPARVVRVAPGPEGVTVTIEGPAGRREERFPVVIDASGHNSVCARAFGLRRRIPGLETHAFFGYFEGLSREPGPSGGNVIIAFCPGGWLWGIPLRHDVTSVGLVLDARAAAERRNPQALLLETAQAYLPYPEALAPRLAGEVRAYGAINYCSTRYAVDRVLLAGDAAAFLDPVFSTGVYLGLWGGREAGRAAAAALDAGDLSAGAFFGYERALRVAHHVCLELVQMFYQGRFANLLRGMEGRPALVEEIVGLLSGDLWSGRGVTSRALLRRADPDVALAPA